ncbi:MAG TPA: NTP transferase domain-containing protein, partial [Actinomycetes bacterium]|nr:NTP transferase domain-containing protein [Actinomycetes bacterium]
MTPPHRHTSPVSGIAGLVLAAGAGRRFGGPKALAEIDGERLVDRAVRALREGGSDPVYVVAGAAPLAVEGAV